MASLVKINFWVWSKKYGKTRNDNVKLANCELFQRLSETICLSLSNTAVCIDAKQHLTRVSLLQTRTTAKTKLEKRHPV